MTSFRHEFRNFLLTPRPHVSGEQLVFAERTLLAVIERRAREGCPGCQKGRPREEGSLEMRQYKPIFAKEKVR